MKKLPKIFIVEDYPFYASILKNEIIKKKLGEIEIFTTGKKIIDNLYKNPNIVLLDYNLNKMNGIDVLKKIKSVNSNTKVILISSQKKGSVVIDSLKNGAFGYIEKSNNTLKRLNTFINLSVKSY